MELVVRDDIDIAAIPAPQWDALVPGQPLLSHAFLDALHATGCASPATGWRPCYLTAWRRDRLVGALPLYAKAHSYGEYVFDWAWADAFRRHGRRYYPKLVAAIPFTPASGPRLLAHDDATRRALLARALAQLGATGERGDAPRVVAARPFSRCRRSPPLCRRGHDHPPRRAIPLGESRLSRLRRLPRGIQSREAQEGETGAAQALRGRRCVPARRGPRNHARRSGRSSQPATSGPTTSMARCPTSRRRSSRGSRRRCPITCCWSSARATAGLCARRSMCSTARRFGVAIGERPTTCQACTSKRATTRRSNSASSAGSVVSRAGRRAYTSSRGACCR